MPAESFGARLRYERERRQIALKSISESTKISLSLLEGLERDDVSRWPSGIFRTSFVRSYAAAIGLDQDVIVAEFVERHPDPRKDEIFALATPAAVSAVAGQKAPPQVQPRPQSPAAPFAVQLTIRWSGSPFGGGTFGSLRRTWLAIKSLSPSPKVVQAFLNK